MRNASSASTTRAVNRSSLARGQPTCCGRLQVELTLPYWTARESEPGALAAHADVQARREHRSAAVGEAHSARRSSACARWRGATNTRLCGGPGAAGCPFLPAQPSRGCPHRPRTPLSPAPVKMIACTSSSFSNWVTAWSISLNSLRFIAFSTSGRLRLDNADVVLNVEEEVFVGQ